MGWKKVFDEAREEPGYNLPTTQAAALLDVTDRIWYGSTRRAHINPTTWRGSMVQWASACAARWATGGSCRPGAANGSRPERKFKGLRVMPKETGIEVLGGYVGDDRWVEAQLLKAVDKMRGKYQALYPLAHTNPQAAFLLLRQCHAQRVTHLLRTHPPHVMRPAAAQWDRNLREHFEGMFELGRLDDAT